MPETKTAIVREINNFKATNDNQSSLAIHDPKFSAPECSSCYHRFFGKWAFLLGSKISISLGSLSEKPFQLQKQQSIALSKAYFELFQHSAQLLESKVFQKGEFSSWNLTVWGSSSKKTASITETTINRPCPSIFKPLSTLRTSPAAIGFSKGGAFLFSHEFDCEKKFEAVRQETSVNYRNNNQSSMPRHIFNYFNSQHKSWSDGFSKGGAFLSANKNARKVSASSSRNKLQWQ